MKRVTGIGGIFFMVNYRVEDLRGLVKVLKEEGCNVLEKIDDPEYGKFASVTASRGKQGRALAAASRPMSRLVSGLAPAPQPRRLANACAMRCGAFGRAYIRSMYARRFGKVSSRPTKLAMSSV